MSLALRFSPGALALHSNSCACDYVHFLAGLCDGLARDLKGRRSVLDGEIVCLDADAKTQFRDLLFRRAEPFFTRSTFCGTSTKSQTPSKRNTDSETAKTFGIYRS